MCCSDKINSFPCKIFHKEGNVYIYIHKESFNNINDNNSLTQNLLKTALWIVLKF